MSQGPIFPAGDPSGMPGPRIAVRQVSWWIFLVVGILCCLTAVGLMAFPWAPVNLLAFIIGASFIASGASAFLLQRGPAGTIGGLLLVVGGVLSIVFAQFTSAVIVNILGFGLLFMGALGLLIAVRAGGSAVVLLPSIVTIAAGVVTLVWPTVALTVVAVFIGLVLFAIGVFTIVQAFALRKQPLTITSI
ncbi:DUF308 domain-containing protein [Leucobacter chinensis]|uniref:DUF308 domain-containing protein n=1 Tax=Leucobacter chinensis TaxID=2851010 RepID=UPI001C24C84C|nr:DUF308 domain-containing protein [Leucobacter chinensis]